MRWELVFARLLSETDRWHRQAKDQLDDQRREDGRDSVSVHHDQTEDN